MRAGSGVVLEISSVTKPSHSGSNGVTFTMMPQRAYVLLPTHTVNTFRGIRKYSTELASANELLRIDDRGQRVGEDLELRRDPHVVAVRGDAVGDHALTNLAVREWLDHPMLFRHGGDPAVGVDGHGAAM